MIKKLFLFLLIPYSAVCQTNSDYLIYSHLINDRISDWKKKGAYITQIVITNRLTDFSIKSISPIVIDEMDSVNLKYNFINYHFFDNSLNIYQVLNNADFNSLKETFKNDSINETDLKAECFTTQIPVIIAKNEWISRLFKKNNASKYAKAWSKFYKDYPNSPGYFEFSKIFYSKNYAMTYFVWRAKPLIGNGELVIFDRKNDEWERLFSFHLWDN